MSENYSEMTKKEKKQALQVANENILDTVRKLGLWLSKIDNDDLSIEEIIMLMGFYEMRKNDIEKGEV